MDITPIFIILGFILLVSIRQINIGQKILVFRWGKFSRFLERSGWHIVVPFFESMEKLDRNETISEKRLLDLMQIGVPPEIVDKLREKS